MKKTILNHAGFTLVEIMVAVFILAFVLTSFLATMVSSSVASAASGNLMAALASAQAKIDEISNSTYTSIVSTYNGQSFSPAQPSGATGAISVSQVGAQNADRLLQVAVTISWTDRNGRSVNTALTSLIAQK